jgi:adenylate cyclase
MSQTFFSLIDDLNAAMPADRATLEESIWREYGTERAVMALDMSQFSLTVRRRGIVPYIAMIRDMQLLTGQIVRDGGGQVVKYHADNLMAIFGDASAAVVAAVRINQSLATAKRQDSPDAYSVSIGIDYGRFLLVDENDCYGDPINIAYKLAEDLGRPHEVLITDAIRKRLGPALTYPVLEQQVSVSGMEFKAFTVKYPEA